jgi:SNF2 family DNA or RNA helicase
MVQDNKTYLIYDKYAKNSGYNNKLTKNITIESLFSYDYKYTEGFEAIKQHNEFCETYRKDLKIPSNLMDYNDIYYPYYFVYEIDGLTYRIMVIRVDNEILEKYFKEQKNIPESDFLITCCDFDKKYKSCGEFLNHGNEKEIQNNIKNITTKVINPNNDPTDPIEHQPDFARIPLFEYQKKTIKWMLMKEKEKKNICLNSNEIVLGNIICDTLMKKILDVESREIIEFHGGALIDEVGLGKTYQMIAMSLCNPSKNKIYICENETNKNNINNIYSTATLVICPNQLVGQWIRELENVVKKEHKISVIPFYTKIHMNKYTYKDLLNADFVITSSTFLNNQCFLSPFVSKISKSKSYLTSSSYSYYDVEKALDEMKQDLKKNIKDKLSEKDVDLLSVFWHRIIIDEFHELYSLDKYKSVEKLLHHFRGNYKWCLTGTPFDKGDESLTGMFDFVTNYNNKSGGKDIWTNEEIIKHMTNNFFRRNTKKSVIDENKLPPLKENIVWLNFSKTEWMMYNAYLANPNIDKFSITLRQLCCHPKIADELKATISNCKSLDEIEKVMVKHYETAVVLANKKVKLSQYRIKRLNRKLEIAEWKQYARILKKIGFRIKFELENLNDIEDEKEIQELAKAIDDNELNLLALDDYDDILKDDEETEANMKKKLMIISNANKEKIIKLTKEEINKDGKSMQRINIENLIKDANDRLYVLMNDYNGKKSTYDYYTEVMNRIKKTSEIDKKIMDFDSDSDSSDSEEGKETCGICLGDITGNDLGVTKCGHIFCYNCVKPFIELKNKCPMCQKGTKIAELYRIEKKIPEIENTQDFKDKQSLINNVGTKLANLIFFLKKNDKHAIIFSQWDDLLKRVGDVLNEYGIKNVFCKGNVWQRDKAIREFNNDDKIKVIMLSSESAASGTNLTKAEMVILLDPVFGSYEYRRNTEWQAIGRAYRTGQTKQVQVVRFIIKDTVEEEIYNLNKKEDEKTKNNEKVILQLETSETKGDNIILDEGEIEELVEISKVNKSTKAKKITKKTPSKKKIVESSSDSSDFSDSDSDSSEGENNNAPKKKYKNK